MGVMNCSRIGCESIMCDKYIPSIGYICYDCQSVFKKLIDTKFKSEPLDLNVGEISIELKKFMKTIKLVDFETNKVDNIDEYFNLF